MSINLIETGFILLYFIVVLGIGFVAKGKIDSEVSYYLANRGLGTLFAGMGRFAAVSSAFTFFGALGLGYVYGLPYLMSIAVGLTFGFLLTLLLLSEIRNSDAVSISDFLFKRYRRKSIRLTAAILSLVVMFPALVAQLRGISVLGTDILGVPGWLAVVVGTVVFTAYVLMGGLWAVSWTNMFQGALLTIFMVVPAVIAFIVYDGMDIVTSAAQIAPQYLEGSDELSVWSHFGIAVTFVGSMMTFPAYVFWSFSAESSSILRKSVVVTMILGTIVYTSWIIVLGAAFVINPSLDNPDSVYFTVIEGLGGGAVMMGLVGAAAFSAVMSSTDGLLIASSSIVTKDIWGAARPKATFESGLRAGRISTVVISSAALVFAFFTPAIIGELIAAGAALAGASFVFPMALGVWWKRMNHVGALAGMTVGFGSFVICDYLLPLPLNVPILIALTASLIASVLGSLATRQDDTEQIRYFEKLHQMDGGVRP